MKPTDYCEGAAMTRPTGEPTRDSEVETRIRAFRHTGPRVMFSDLAEALPDCSWQMLFGALS